MPEIKRQSSVVFRQRAHQREIRNGWEVILAYEDEGEGPFLIDLSHLPKWDLQGENLPERRPAGIMVPNHSGHCRLERGMLINVIKWNWAVIWCLSEAAGDFSQESAFTNVTDKYALLLVLGKEAFSIMEKVTALDLAAPTKQRPFLSTGPVLDIRSQVIVMGNDCPGVFVACPRGYGHAMADGLLEAGSEYGLCPAGEKRIDKWLGEVIYAV